MNTFPGCENGYVAITLFFPLGFLQFLFLQLVGNSPSSFARQYEMVASAQRNANSKNMENWQEGRDTERNFRQFLSLCNLFSLDKQMSCHHTAPSISPALARIPRASSPCIVCCSRGVPSALAVSRGLRVARLRSYHYHQEGCSLERIMARMVPVSIIK